MTCIVALIDGNKTYMAADSAGFDPHGRKQTRKDRKLFFGKTKSDQPFMIGYTTSFRMGQIIAHEFIPSGYKNKDGDDKDISEDALFNYMVTVFVKEVKRAFKDGGFGTINEGEPSVGGTFIVAINKKIYSIEADFQVADPDKNYLSCGSGCDYAYASLYTSEKCNAYSSLPHDGNDCVTPKERLEIAIQSAMEFSSFVGGQIFHLEMEH